MKKTTPYFAPKVTQKKLTKQETTAIAKSMRKGQLDVHLWNKIDLKIWASAVVKCLMSETKKKHRLQAQ